MKKLFDQIRERHIWRVLVGYPSVTFVLLQAIEFFINNYGLDARLLTVGIIVAVILLPAAFIWNWQHGEAGEQAFSRPELGAYLLCILGAFAGAYLYWQSAPPDQPVLQPPAAVLRTVAVLPFENPAGNAEVQYLCDGIAESLINWLATVPDIKVVSKSASFRMRDEVHDTAKLASELGVDSLVRGKLELVDEQLVVSASLVDTRDESQVWGERLVEPAARILDLERSIVAALKDGLRINVSDTSGAGGEIGGTNNPEAYQHYLRGHYLIQATSIESLQQGLDELRAAIRLDPSYARPYADISDSLSQMLSYGLLKGESLVGEASTAAYTAVALAPELAESHTALATIQQYFEFDWPAVDASYEAAIGLAPISPVPYHRYTDYLVLTLRFDRAREMARRAIEIDPLDSSSMHAVGLVELLAGDFSAASQAFGEWNRFHPESRWSYVKHALALSLNGQCDDAQKQAAVVEDYYQGKASALMESWLAWGYKVCGNEEWYTRSKQRIEAIFAADPGSLDPGLAYLLALEGETEQIVDMFQKIYEKRQPFVLFGQLFVLDYLGWGISDTMPVNARYQELLDKINFPPNPVRTGSQRD